MTATARAVDSHHTKSWHRYELLLLGLIIALGASLRIARARFEPLIFDEVWHLELSTGRGSLHGELPADVPIASAPDVTSLRDAPPWYSVWTHMSGVVDPPLFNLLLRLWRDAFGAGDLPAKMFSIGWSLLAIGILYFAGRSLHGPGAALWGALIFAAAPMQVWVDQQIRGYAMLQAISIATLWIVISIEKAESFSIPLAIALGMGLLVMMLTHYFAIAGAMAIGVYILVRWRGRKRVLAIVAMLAAAAIFFIIWFPFLLPQRAFAWEADRWFAEPAGAAHVFKTLQRAIAWPARLLADFDMDNPVTCLFGGLFIVPLFMLRKKPELLLWYIWLVFTIGFIAGLDLARGTKQLDFPRYLSPAAPVCFMLFVAMAWQLSGWLRHILPAAVAITALALTTSSYKFEQADWPALARIIDEHANPDETIVYYAPQMMEIYYLTTSHYSHQFPRPIMKLSGPASPQLVDQIPGKTAWFITSGDNKDISADLPGTTVIHRFDFPQTPFQPACIHIQLPPKP